MSRCGQIGIVWLLALAMGLPAMAQISPGELSQAHADLDTNDQCLSCHSADRAVDPANCLDCHEILAERIEDKAGLHAREDHQDCRTCHIEHHSRGFELIYWEGGPRSFDHEDAGYSLVGKHAELQCRDCHKAELVIPKERFLAAKKDLDRTFLGLGTACLDCHEDTHRGQLAQECLDCHNQDAWTPAPGFDHDETNYPLIGAHRNADCAECHPTQTDATGSFTQYSEIEAGSCTVCHDDQHEGRFGNRCQTCHSSTAWFPVLSTTSFDHDQTDFPLVGLHRDVECESCHTGRQTDPIPGFERCVTCHEDEHLGQLAHRDDGGDCESCHSVERPFSPASYTANDHETSAFPLVGSHLAVACPACHRPISPDEVAKLVRLPISAERITTFREEATMQLLFARTWCIDCHEDPHEGRLDRYQEQEDGCRSCHELSSWRQVSFDHDEARFALQGSHRDVACEECHPRSDGTMKLAEVGMECQDCHDDPHGGQLDRNGLASCDSCHTEEDWRPTLFEHNRDAAFIIDGAHEDVHCEGCHLPDNTGAIVYKPIPHECIDCHGGD